MWLLRIALIFSLAHAAEKSPVPVGSIIDGRGETGEGVRFRVDGASPDAEDPEKEIWLYEISVERGGKWSPYCAADAAGSTKAVPLEGRWDASGKYFSEPLVTFACVGGALAKCARWGYKPWKLRDLHQACVRMVRADYCGDGKSHTREGVLIRFHDTAGIHKPSGRTDFSLEAGWSPSGATFLSKSRLPGERDKIVAECPGRRLGKRAREASETLLFNESP